MVRATVLVPTHDHGSLLRLAVESALAQTVDDLEVVIVCDGADAATTEAARDVAAADPRIRLLSQEKGEGAGEAHRHLALAGALGTIVCYLADDDLWLSDHVEYLETLLADADFAHSLAVVARPEGGFHIPHLGDLSDPWYQEQMRFGLDFVPLSTAGHTLAAYRALATGWSPAPLPTPSHQFMWRKFLDAPGMRFASGGRPTVVTFPSSARGGMDLVSRETEARRWRESLGSPTDEARLRGEVADHLIAWATSMKKSLLVEAELARSKAQLTVAHRLEAEAAITARVTGRRETERALDERIKTKQQTERQLAQRINAKREVDAQLARRIEAKRKTEQQLDDRLPAREAVDTDLGRRIALKRETDARLLQRIQARGEVDRRLTAQIVKKQAMAHQLTEQVRALRKSEKQLAAKSRQLAEQNTKLAAPAGQIERLSAELAAIKGSLTYRAGRRLATLPLLGRFGRWVAKRLARSPR